MTGRTRAASTLVVAAVAALVLHRLGTGALAAPDGLGPEALARWAGERGTAAAAVAVVRVLALAAAVVTAGLAGAVLAAGALRVPALGAAALRVAPRPLRRALGAGVAATLTFVPASTAGGAASPSSSDVPVLVQVDGAPAPSDAAPPTMVVRDTAPEAPPAPAAPPATAPAATAPLTPAPPPAVSTWTVAPGEHLWAVAEATVAARGGGDLATVARYWRALVDANHDRFVVPGDPDLVFPGQQLVLPPGP